MSLKAIAKLSGVLSSGYSDADYNIGTVSSGTVTPDPVNNNMQRYTNNGAHTLAPPSSITTMVIQITNGASAGTITTSGFTKVTGDSFDTTNAHVFTAYITKNQASSVLNIVAMQ